MEVLLVIISFVLGWVLGGIRRNARENRAFDAKMEDMGQVFFGEFNDSETFGAWIDSLVKEPKRGPGRPKGSTDKVKKAGK